MGHGLHGFTWIFFGGLALGFRMAVQLRGGVIGCSYGLVFDFGADGHGPGRCAWCGNVEGLQLNLEGQVLLSPLGGFGVPSVEFNHDHHVGG